MGMFDYIKHKDNCPLCGIALEGFQSKDSECLLEEIEPEKVQKFYTSCDNCGISIEYNWEKCIKRTYRYL